jgi:IS4 transposase
MDFVTFIHNDDVKCFHVVVQGTHKLVVIGRINFEDHALIKRRWENEKMNVMGKMFKDEKKQGNRRKQFTFVVGSCARFRSFRIHNSMNVKSAIEKLKWITREKEV